MQQAYFITGTDTGVGKTTVTVALLHHFNQRHKKTAALKPIASGCLLTKAGWRNDDALQLQAAMSMSFPYKQVNPFAFERATTPHLAAQPQSLDVQSTLHACQAVLNSDYEYLFVEGAGGWLTPLNQEASFADLAQALGFPIILVVGLRLGCLNHAQLTWEHIQKLQRLPFAGWIANHMDPMFSAHEAEGNIETLTAIMDQPPLAQLSYRAIADPTHATLELRL